MKLMGFEQKTLYTDFETVFPEFKMKFIWLKKVQKVLKVENFLNKLIKLSV